jgi:RNA polymerase sigma factor (sigma-70 family)
MSILKVETEKKPEPPVFEDYYDLIKSLAKMIRRKNIAINWLTQEDIVSMSYPPFLEASKSWLSKNRWKKYTDFAPFLTQVIKRRIIDEFRSLSWASRYEINKIKNTEGINIKYEIPFTTVVPAGASQSEIKYWEDELMMSLETSGRVSNPEDNNNNLVAFEDYISCFFLSSQEKIVLILTYVYGYTLVEIGEKLGLTDTRICQIKSSSLAFVKSLLEARRRVT